MKNKKGLLALVTLVVVVGLALGVYLVLRPTGTADNKTIEVTANFTDGTQEVWTIDTNEEFLRGALEQENIIAGNESDYGLFVTSVNGVVADENNQEWWCFTKGGEMLMTGVDETPIADGDAFEITQTIGY